MQANSTARGQFMRLRPLSKQEIDRCIERLLSDVAASIGVSREGEDGSELRPKLISAAEIVERVRPFLSLN